MNDVSADTTTTTISPWAFTEADNAAVQADLNEFRTQQQQRFQAIQGLTSAAMQRSPEASPMALQQDEDTGVFGVVGDVFKGVGNGVAGFAQSMVGLADGAVEMFGGDLVDDEKYKSDVFGEQQTFLGGLVKGVVQFSLGWVTGSMALNVLSKGAKAAGFLGAASKLGVGGGASRQLANSAGADFLAFHETEERLSNLIEGTPLANPVTAYLAAEEDDDFLLGRVKNVAEGLLVGVAFQGVGRVFAAGIKGLKVALGANAAGATADAAASAGQAAAAKYADAILSAEEHASAVAASKSGTGGPGASDILATEKGQAFETTLKEQGVDIDAIFNDLDKEVDDVITNGRSLADVQATIDNHLTHINKRTTFTEPETEALMVRMSQVTDRIVQKFAPTGRVMTDMDKAARGQIRHIFEDLKAGEGLSMERLILSLERDAVASRSMLSRAMSYRYMHGFATQTMKQTAEDLAQTGTKEAALAYRLARDWAVNIHSNYVVWRRSIAQTLRSMGQGLDMTGFDQGAIKGFVDTATSNLEKGLKARGLNPDKQLIQANIDNPGYLATLKDEASLVAQAHSYLGGIKVVTRPSLRRALEANNEYLLNALLSSPLTHAVNLISNTAKAVLAPAEQALGGVLTFNKAAVSDAMGQYAGYIHGLWDAFKMAGKAAWRGDSIAVPGSMEGVSMASAGGTPFGRGGLMGPGRGSIKTSATWEGTVLGAAANLMGEAVRMPGRMLIAGDELFKQLTSRSKLYSRYYKEATDLDLWNGGSSAALQDLDWQALSAAGGNPRKLASEWIAMKINKSFDGAGKLLDKGALKHASEMTFTQELGFDTIGGRIQSLVTHHPALRPIIPFVKTPVNLFREAYSRLPVFGQYSREMRGWLDSGDPELVAKAYGRWAVGMTGSVLVMNMVMNGSITGSGPLDARMNEMKRSTGWQPYSIAFEGPDGSTSYLAYNRMDPMGSFLGFLSDIGDVMMHAQDGPEKDNIAAAVLASFSNMLVNKTYLKGLSDFMEAITANDEQVLNNYIKGVTAGYVPNFLKWWANDEMVRETYDMAVALKRKTPGYGEIPPKRNILGEPIVARSGTWELGWQDENPDKQNILNTVSPFSYSKSLPNDVMKELASLGRAFTKLPANQDGVDLRTVRNADGQYAYDRFQELVGEVKVGGKTLRERLTEFVKSDVYKTIRAADPEREEAADAVAKIIKSYRNVARGQLWKEYPQLLQHRITMRKQYADEFRRIEQQRRGSMGLDDFVESLAGGN